MQFRLTYQEISDLIARKAGRSVPVLYGGPHTVRIGLDVNVLFKTANIGLDLTVDQVDENGNIYLTYNGGMGIDFMIRTSGEIRISNFMLWQISYAELYFPKCYFPDFNHEEYDKALIEFTKRDRRFGGLNKNE